MKTYFFLRCIVMAVICLSACTKFRGEQCFRFPVKKVDDVKALQTLTPDYVCNTMEGELYLNIVDSLYISFSRQRDNLCSIYNLNDNFKLLGVFCPRGRALEEIISLSGINDIWTDNSNLLMPLYALAESKLLILNLSESLSQHKTVYSSITRLSKEAIKPIYNCYILDPNHILAYNSNQNPVIDEMLDPPVIEIYDIHNGSLIRTIEIFNKIEGYNDPYYNSLSFVSNFTCIKPDRTKLVFAMYYHPQFNILNIETGKTLGFAISGRPAFSLKHPVGHFIAVASDNENIYALYQETNPKDNVRQNATLYIIDWDGQIKAHFNLAQYYDLLCVDGDILYLGSRISDELYKCPTRVFKASDSRYISSE